MTSSSCMRTALFALTALVLSTGAPAALASTLTVQNIAAANRTYDGTASATLLNLGGATLVGVAAGDQVGLDTSGAVGTFLDKNVGNAKDVSVSGLALSGKDASKYTLILPTTHADITPRAIAVTATGVSKAFDGTTAATVTLATDAPAGSDVRATYAGASFASSGVGTNIPIHVTGIALTGSDAGNYRPPADTADTSANITAASQTATSSTANATSTSSGGSSSEATTTITGTTTSTATSTVTATSTSSNTVSSGGGSAGNSSSGGGTGRVLGASTSTAPVAGGSCGVVNSYLRMGRANNEKDVLHLQQFLLAHGYASGTPSGVFDETTRGEVMAFQKAYADAVLVPWGLSAPTGVVYITTIRQMSRVMCPGIQLLISPSLVPWES